MGAFAHGDLARIVNDKVVGIVQIESAATVEAAGDIAALDEVDVLFVGPADLTHALGIPGRFDEPQYLDALRRVVDACDAHGKAAGILIYDTAALPPLIDLGFRFIGLGSEGSYVSAGARAMLTAAGRSASA
jgi:2-dehydro-3-deoxyglucarate aldolase/4-hydroxy-2-oxoheptanedioate aldolase